MSKTSTGSYERFPLARRIEHFLMLTSFTLLGLTGLPQKYADAGISIAVLKLLGGIEGLRMIHHVAAIVMMLGTVWHLLYFGYISFVRREPLSMLPSLQDAKDGLQAFLYNIGFAKNPPQMGRYTFEEKMEYWAFVWGTIVMVVTGFMMWNPISTVKFLPGEFVPAAKAAHGGEAVLAVLAIIVWHMYGVHVKRFNRSMFTGQMSEEDMLHEHPLELADIKAGLYNRPIDPAVLRKRQRVYIPIAAVLAVLMLGGVYGFVNAEDTALETTERMIPTIEIYVPQTATPAPTQTPTPIPLPTEPVTGTQQPASASAPTWDGEIGAIFSAQCSMCHGEKASGGLNLLTYASVMQGGSNGPVVIPNDSGSSILISNQAAGGHFAQLSTEEIVRIVQWIDSGALEK